MVEDLDAILAIWEEYITNFSPTMVEDLDAIIAIWDELNYKFFFNHGGVFRRNSSNLRWVKLQNFLQPWWNV